MFTNARNFKIDNSHIVNVNTHPAGPTGIDILLEASAPEAAHDSSARDPPPRCFPGTREEFVEDIIEWAVPPVGGKPLPVYWMKGPAGVGKSAVAQSCIEKLKYLGTRSPAFFFSINGWNKHQGFFPSIAYQLSTIYPDYHDLIDRKIRRNRTLVNKTLETQFWGLLVEPLQELEERGRGIGKRVPVFVDGLDECESQDAQCEIIEIVTSAARDNAVPLCWMFFSRPEPHIEATFSKIGISSLCNKTILPISRNTDGDIELYLRVGFENILRRLNITRASPWPSDGDLKELVRAAGGLFIYAKTILRFVGQPSSLDPDRLLRVIIAVISSRSQYGPIAEPIFAELDAFYTLIMQRIPVKMLPTIHRVLAVLCWGGCSSAIMIANFSGLSRVELEAVCNQLGAVVQFQRQREPLKLEPATDAGQSFLRMNSERTVETFYMIIDSLGGSISFYHKSFQDFLLDPRRSGIYCISTVDDLSENQEGDLALRFEGHGWQSSESTRAPGASDSTSNLSNPYANELVSSLIETWIYIRTNDEAAPPEVEFDFCGHLYVFISIAGTMSAGQGMLGIVLYRCAGLYKHVRRTLISWFQPGEFAKFDVVGFKKDIERWQQKNIIRPRYATSSFLGKTQVRVESGLYALGRDSEPILWYWEINYDLESYREFWTLDLAEGEALYREQWCDSLAQD